MLKANLTDRPEKIVASKIIGFKGAIKKYELRPKDAIIYALSLNYSRDPLNTKDLQFTYELDEMFKISPTIATVIHNVDVFEMITSCPEFPEFNPMMILHGEQSVEFLRPIKEGTYFSQGTFVDVQDKGKGALLVIRIVTSLSQDLSDPVCINFVNLFIRGQGNFDENKVAHKTYIEIPKLTRDSSLESAKHKTDESQAILYRLNGDYNPLHVDLTLAEMGGFKRPILHGLCTFGIAAKVILERFCENNPLLLKKISGRFIGFVYPGNVLVVQTSRKGNEIAFTVSSEEGGKEVLVGGAVIASIPDAKL